MISIIELQILIMATTMAWFRIGMHRSILKLLGRDEWDHIKPITCWFCTQQWFGFAIIAAHQLSNGYDLKILIFALLLNYIVSRMIDRTFGFDLGLKAQIKMLENEIKKMNDQNGI